MAWVTRAHVAQIVNALPLGQPGRLKPLRQPDHHGRGSKRSHVFSELRAQRPAIAVATQVRSAIAITKHGWVVAAGEQGVAQRIIKGAQHGGGGGNASAAAIVPRPGIHGRVVHVNVSIAALDHLLRPRVLAPALVFNVKHYSLVAPVVQVIAGH